MTRSTVALIALLSALPNSARGQVKEPTDFFAEKAPRAQVLVLGTFHFRNSNLDAYKPKHAVNIMSAIRQREVEDVVERLARFAPTKVAVEAKLERQAALDTLYRAYRAGQWELAENEIYQIGFRLAARLNHARVYAVDAPPRPLLAGLTSERWDSMTRSYAPLDTTWDMRYQRWYEWQDSVKATVPLRDFLLYLNDSATVRRSHGHYLVSTFKRRKADDYFGPDADSHWWGRNLRIFSNIQRITSSPRERIVFIVGAGHLPLLQEAIRHSPEHRLVEAAAYLK
jgi:hypothetical protein